MRYDHQRAIREGYSTTTQPAVKFDLQFQAGTCPKKGSSTLFFYVVLVSTTYAVCIFAFGRAVLSLYGVGLSAHSAFSPTPKISSIMLPFVLSLPKEADNIRALRRKQRNCGEHQTQRIE
jgi:hypothetical protein